MNIYHDPTYLDIVLMYGFDVRRRRFVLHGDIDHEDEHGKNPITHAVNALLYLDQGNCEEIEFWICTPGGDSAEMFGLYDIIRSRRSKVHTIGFGKIYSAGVLLLSAGDRRSVTENAFLMSHAESCGADTKLSVWAGKQTIDAQIRMEQRWAELMARHTNHDKGWWHRLHQGKMHELWLDAQEMIDIGIADDTIPDTVLGDGSLTAQ